VDNLHKLIYDDVKEQVVDEKAIDSNRYDVHHSKLDIFKNAGLKRMLKSRFVTG
jgi:hypothetical protein